MMAATTKIGETTTAAVVTNGQPAGQPAPAIHRGLSIPRVFSTEWINPYDQVAWETRTAAIKGDDGRVVFEQTGVEAPAFWSQMAVDVVVSKYFYGDLSAGNGSPRDGKREHSVRQLVGRVATTIGDWGDADGYFETRRDADTFTDELAWLLLNQHGAFNSPVWFNMGLHHAYGLQGSPNGWRRDMEFCRIVPNTDCYKYPGISACFIQSVTDDMEGIMGLATSEAMLFKNGAGSGSDLSSLRSSKEKLTGGGKPSGPVSFMRIYDAVAGVIKSGGRNRRSAKLQALRCDHPDILDFIRCKVKEERKAKALVAAGYSGGMDGEATTTVCFQNSNLSVSATDAFLRLVESGGSLETIAVTTGKIVDRLPAGEVMDEIARSAWACADPGLLFIDTMNRWHTVPNHGPITCTNPCGEYAHVDDSACNLASLNLMRFRRPDGSFDADRFRAAVRIFIVAQEILVDRASYPTEAIARNSHAYRPLGLGYCGLGALVMAAGLPYDSDAGRALAASITAIMTGEAYLTSAQVATVKGPFEGFAANREPMLKVIGMHRDEARALWHGERHGARQDATLAYFAANLWDECLKAGERWGYRNAQVSLLAPTGCVTADTLLLTSEGLLPIARLGDVAGETWQGVQFTVQQEKIPNHASQFYVNGLKPVYRIVTEAGHVLRATGNHRIRVIDTTGEYAWRRMDEIRPGDVACLRLGGHEEILGDAAAVPLANAWPGVPSALDQPLARVIGFYMGNGYTKARGGLHLVINDDDRDLIDCFSTDLGRSGTLEERDGCFVLNFFDGHIAEWFEVNGFSKDKGSHGEGAASAFIPEAVLRSRSSILCAFLSGLFTADGTVTIQNSGVPVVELSTASPTLATQVQVALEALGIRARRSVNTDRESSFGSRAIYRIRVASVSDCALFAATIGFCGHRKQRRLTDALDASPSISSRGDRIEHQVLIDDFYACAEGLGNAVRQDIIQRKRQGAFNRAWAARKIAESPKLHDSKIGRLLAVGNLQFVPIVAAEPDGMALTYDISVPEANTYVANGFMSHNTIAFMMDSGDSTGVEPALALVQYKSLAGGGMLKIVNRTVPMALKTLGYDDGQVKVILKYIDIRDTIEGCPLLKSEHLSVFDCAFPPAKGGRSIPWMGHLKMVAAVQPFLSGSISKTVNMPNDSTIADIKSAYLEAWRLGLKDVALYRDGCKEAQPVSTSRAKVEPGPKADPVAVPPIPVPRREKLPTDCTARRHKFRVGGCKGYLHIGLYPDGRPGEIFITGSKEGSTIGGLLDTVATLTSIGLQYGVPLEALVEKFKFVRFEPSGTTGNPAVPFASSLIDYIFRWLGVEFLPGYQEANGPKRESDDGSESAPVIVPASAPVPLNAWDGPPCDLCGSLTVRSGACWRCLNCGSSLGCS